MQESPTAETTSARDFVERQLRADPECSFTEIRDRAARVGLNVHRFLYGSSRRALGLPPRPESDEAEARDAQAEAAGDEPRNPAASDADAAVARAEIEPSAGAVEVPAERAPAAGPKKGAAFAFALEVLRMSPDISFQDLKARAMLANMQVPPIVFGRAKALLGLVPTKPRRARAEPPRLLRQVESAAAVSRLPALDGIRSVEQLVQTVRALENERQRLRALLAAIKQSVDEALADEG
jgi:hypothetical protein